jgi:hypothetical protein
MIDRFATAAVCTHIMTTRSDLTGGQIIVAEDHILSAATVHLPHHPVVLTESQWFDAGKFTEYDASVVLYLTVHGSTPLRFILL